VTTALAEDLAVALDPVRLAGSIGMALDPWQEEVLRTADDVLLNCSRQAGKSTVAALKGVHTALYEPEALVLLLSPGLRQSGELFKKCLWVYRSLGRPIPAESETALTLQLEHGSRIVSLPGKEGTIRSFSSVRLLIIDESSRVLDETYMSARPMLAVSGGQVAALSTPFGTRGWWYEEWRNGAGWKRFEVPATKCPRIPAEFLEEERRRMGEWWYRQEYGCSFLDAQTQAFRREDIDRAFSEGVEAWEL
jgi:hypothetical protein